MKYIDHGFSYSTKMNPPMIPPRWPMQSIKAMPIARFAGPARLFKFQALPQGFMGQLKRSANQERKKAETAPTQQGGIVRSCAVVDSNPMFRTICGMVYLSILLGTVLDQ